MKPTEVTLARMLLLRFLGPRPARATDVLAIAKEYRLGDFVHEAIAGLGIAQFKQDGELCWALPPNMVGFLSARIGVALQRRRCPAIQTMRSRA
jgi:hypothetical protein